MGPAPPAAGDPLRGANLFVDGPAYGSATGAIARLEGIDPGVPLGQPLPSISPRVSWARFAALVRKSLRRLAPTTRRQILLLEKIAAEPETQRISRYSEGGTPAGIYSQAEKVYCHLLAADPGSVPVVSTYFLHPELENCPTDAQDAADRPTFEAQIDALARATGNRPVVFLLEIDAVGSSACISGR